MAIDRAEVARIAELARLEIPDDELERTARELSAVLDFVATLERLDLDGLRAHGVRAGATRRCARTRPTTRRLDARAGAGRARPRAEDGFFLVPPIVENVNP